MFCASSIFHKRNNFYLQNESNAVEEPIVHQLEREEKTVVLASVSAKKLVSFTKSFSDVSTSSITWFHLPVEKFSSKTEVYLSVPIDDGFMSPELGKLCQQFSAMSSLM